MKKIIFLTILFFPFILLAQNISETTHDEYKYLSKGYAYQKEMGLDGSKEGYSVKALFSASNGVQFNGLFSQDERFKGLLIIVNPNSENPIYLGKPTNSSSAELRGLAEEEAKEKLNLSGKEKYDQALLEFTMANLGGGKVASNYVAATKKNIKIENNSDPIKEYNNVDPLRIERTEEMTQRSGISSTPKIEKINNNVITSHDFAERNFTNSPVVRGQNPSSGTVVIKMCIDNNGDVKTAKFTQRGSTTFDKKLRKMALEAARKVKFSEGLDKEQCGTIKFIFKNI